MFQKNVSEMLKKSKKISFDELKKIGLDLTPYKEDYPEFFKKIIELFIKLKNEGTRKIFIQD